MDHIMICCVCLGDNSEDADEIIQCDNCGITVHEGNSVVTLNGKNSCFIFPRVNYKEYVLSLN